MKGQIRVVISTLLELILMITRMR